MTTFLIILFVLLAVNALLMVFSINGIKGSQKKPFQNAAKSPDIKLFQGQYSETEYKEAV